MWLLKAISEKAPGVCARYFVRRRPRCFSDSCFKCRLNCIAFTRCTLPTPPDAHWHTHTHTQAQALTHTLKHTHACACTRMHAPTQTHARTHTNTHARKQTHTHTYAHAQKQRHTNVHTHTRMHFPLGFKSPHLSYFHTLSLAIPASLSPPRPSYPPPVADWGCCSQGGCSSTLCPPGLTQKGNQPNRQHYRC